MEKLNIAKISEMANPRAIHLGSFRALVLKWPVTRKWLTVE